MKRVLWFCRTSDSSSLSRITDSLVSIIDADVTLLSNQTKLKGVKHIQMGSDTSYISYSDYIKSVDTTDIRSANMKYTIVQIVDLIYNNDFDTLFICNGLYEIGLISKLLTSDSKYLTNKNGKKTKLVVWVPIDYIPSPKSLEYVIRADKFITMNPVMSEEIRKITGVNVEWVGHGSDLPRTDFSTLTRKCMIERLKGIKIYCKTPVKESDIIILNANNYGPLERDIHGNLKGTRKRLDITLKSFMNLKRENVKLWIHTRLKSFFEMLEMEKINIASIIDNIILSENNVTNEQLSYIYSISDISLQTSTGEGWSLTNLEASMCRSLQVVPDFLACGFHYSNNRGILIPVERKVIKCEANTDVIVGEVSVENTTTKLLEAIDLLQDKQKLNEILDNAEEYAKKYTWKSVAEQLVKMF